MTLEDAFKLDSVREALRANDIDVAKNMAKVYILKPVAA